MVKIELFGVFSDPYWISNIGYPPYLLIKVGLSPKLVVDTLRNCLFLSLRMFRVTFRMFQVSFRMFRTSFKMLQTSVRMFRTQCMMFRTSFRMFRTSFRMFRTSFRMFRTPGWVKLQMGQVIYYSHFQKKMHIFYISEYYQNSWNYSAHFLHFTIFRQKSFQVHSFLGFFLIWEQIEFYKQNLACKIKQASG